MEQLVSDEKLNETACKIGFKKRASLLSPRDFIEIIFHESVNGNTSLSQYCTNFYHSTGKKISKQAIDKRFRSKAKEFFAQLLEKVMQKHFSLTDINTNQNVFSEIRIMDSTEFKLSPVLSELFPGYGGKGREAMAKIQFEFELLKGRITQLRLGNSLNSDVSQGLIHLDDIPERAMLIRDMGYVNTKVYKELIKRKIFFISRLKPQINIYIKKNGILEPLKRTEIYQMLLERKTKYLDIEAYVGSELKIPVRLIANLLGEEQKTRRIKRKIKNKGTANNEDMFNACFNIMVTNVEKEVCDPEKIYDLYRIRWQIELIFKAWKSILRIHQINPMNPQRFECLMYVKFLWILLNWSLVQLFSNLSMAEISHYKFAFTLIKHTQSLIRKSILANGSLYHLLNELFELSIVYHQKEHKKGRPKIKEILNLKH